MIKIKITVSTMQKMNLFEKNMKKFLLCFKTITEVNKFYLLLKQYQFDQVEKQKSPFYYICIRMSDISKIQIFDYSFNLLPDDPEVDDDTQGDTPMTDDDEDDDVIGVNDNEAELV